MPINPDRMKLYHRDWPAISLLVRQRANWKCELCPAEQGKPHWKTKGLVVLTVHHINGDPSDNRRANLIALCQRCHLRLDRAFFKSKTVNHFCHPFEWLPIEGE